MHDFQIHMYFPECYQCYREDMSVPDPYVFRPPGNKMKKDLHCYCFVTSL
jgi:hypothetical protein